MPSGLGLHARKALRDQLYLRLPSHLCVRAAQFRLTKPRTEPFRHHKTGLFAKPKDEQKGDAP